jgi:hypothetical protein
LFVTDIRETHCPSVIIIDLHLQQHTTIYVDSSNISLGSVEFFFLHLQWRKIFLFSLLPSGEASLHQNVNMFPADIVSKL